MTLAPVSGRASNVTLGPPPGIEMVTSTVSRDSTSGTTRGASNTVTLPMLNSIDEVDVALVDEGADRHTGLMCPILSQLLHFLSLAQQSLGT